MRVKLTKKTGIILTLVLLAAGYFGFFRKQAGTSVSDNPTSSDKQEVVVYRSRYCGCCGGWITYLKRKGYKVKTVYNEDMASIKDKYGVPRSLESCHTAVIGEYVVEGHIPVEAIEKLLSEKPDIDGISLPGMPAGSPGMSGVKTEKFNIVAFKDGKKLDLFTSL